MDKLLDKYYEGLTSSEEEQLLAEMLRRNSDPRYDADRRLICGLYGPMPDFGAMADRASRRRVTLPVVKWLSAAASVAIVFFSAVMLFRSEPTAAPEVAQDMTVEEAAEQTRMALMLFAQAFDRGCDEINKLQDL